MPKKKDKQKRELAATDTTAAEHAAELAGLHRRISDMRQFICSIAAACVAGFGLLLGLVWDTKADLSRVSAMGVASGIGSDQETASHTSLPLPKDATQLGTHHRDRDAASVHRMLALTQMVLDMQIKAPEQRRSRPELRSGQDR